jgi:hypothetical protein
MPDGRIVPGYSSDAEARTGLEPDVFAAEEVVLVLGGRPALSPVNSL